MWWLLIALVLFAIGSGEFIINPDLFSVGTGAMTGSILLLIAGIISIRHKNRRIGFGHSLTLLGASISPIGSFKGSIGYLFSAIGLMILGMIIMMLTPSCGEEQNTES